MGTFLRQPYGILLVFGALLLAVGGFTAFDSSRRTELEGIVMPSSSGDNRFFPDPERFKVFDEVVRQGAQPYYLARKGIANRSDDRMVPTGFDDTGAWTLYRLEIPESAPGGTDLRYLKTARNRYITVTSASPPPR
jgi:hypothetical protein